MERIINMIIRQVMRRVITKGIDKGVDMAAKRKGNKRLTPEQQKLANENKKRAQQAMRVARRFGR